MSGADLVTLARDLLAAVEDAYVAEGETPPERRGISLGPVIDDCDQLLVAFQGITNGVPTIPNTRPELCGGPRYATFIVAVTRCAEAQIDAAVGEGAELPSVADLEVDADRGIRDAYTMHIGLAKVIHAAAPFRDRDEIFIGPTSYFGSPSDVWRIQTIVSVEVL